MPMRPFATQVVEMLVKAGHTAYFAGGWVRDFLMQHPSDDIDIATSASVVEVQRLFPKTVPVGVAFGIVIVVWDGHPFEVATFRKDRGYSDGRRPSSIEPATPYEDAERRDFTINGMFYDPLQDKLYDYVGGQEDLKKEIIRAIGDPHERFLEDRLRMMRAVRYATRFGFPIEDKTRQAILAHAHSLLPAVAMERVWQEFKKMSHFAHFDRGLAMLHELQLLPTIFPALQGVSLKEIQARLHPLNVYPAQTPAVAELLPLFPSYALEELLRLCDYLKLSREEREFACFLEHAKQMLEMPEEWQKKLEAIEWVRLYAHAQICLILEIIAAHLPEEKRKPFLTEHTKRRERLDPFIRRVVSQTPVVSAAHLMALGVPPGKKMGLLLKEAERIAAEAALEHPEKVIALLKNSPLWHNA